MVTPFTSYCWFLMYDFVIKWCHKASPHRCSESWIVSGGDIKIWCCWKDKSTANSVTSYSIIAWRQIIKYGSRKKEADRLSYSSGIWIQKPDIMRGSSVSGFPGARPRFTRPAPSARIRNSRRKFSTEEPFPSTFKVGNLRAGAG